MKTHHKFCTKPYSWNFNISSLENLFNTIIKSSFILFLAFAALPSQVLSAGASLPIPPTLLTSTPPYAEQTGDKPTVVLGLSVEFPTIGAQYYNNSAGGIYSNAKVYYGYFNTESCYTYIIDPSETLLAGQTKDDYRRFSRSGNAINRTCSDAFSGNFLNWASSTAIDMLRLALSGGDRLIDLPNLTILQRAMSLNGDPRCHWNDVRFPAKQLPKSGGTSGVPYFGAVPKSMQSAAGLSDIWVANTLNKIFFGTSRTGSCDNTSDYRLGMDHGQEIGPIDTRNTTLPASATFCSSADASCTGFSGTKEIWYGANGNWKVAPAKGSVNCSNTVFGDPAIGSSKSCYYNDYLGPWRPSTFYYARVEVCSSSTGLLQDTRDYPLCKLYPSGNYKPIGAIQRYGDKLRISAFSYLLDQTPSWNGRYGAVMRSPMKYVGNKTFNEKGVDNTPPGGNPNAEWDKMTGVFASNPDGSISFPRSGVINYLNQFGRTGQVKGKYKIYDPVGEMHYEALRYLQGLPPSPDAIKDITLDMYDGFPVETVWKDPFGGSRSNTADYSCLKSNILIVGDINTNDGGRLPTPNPSQNIPDINEWRKVVQHFEKGIALNYIDGQGITRTTSNPNPPNDAIDKLPFPVNRTQILGTAYWANTHDIRGVQWSDSAKRRPGLRVKTMFFDVNERGEQSDPEQMKNKNQFFTAAKYGGFKTIPDTNTDKSYNTQGNPFFRDDHTPDKYIWEDTDTSPSRKGIANNYFIQEDGKSVLTSMDEIFQKFSMKRQTIVGAATQSNSLTINGNFLYLGSFNSEKWYGDVVALPVVVDPKNPTSVTVQKNPKWSAASQLKQLQDPVKARNIVVGNSGATASPTATDFTWSAIDDNLKQALSKATPSSPEDKLGEDRLNYIRGDRSKESGVFRPRDGFLGDIINSGVVYSGAPTTKIMDVDYPAFQVAKASRTPAVFVGANDGMLHAFNAENGSELFAYIPSWIAPRLPALAQLDYDDNHQSFVDSTPEVAEAKVGANWKTVLVSGTGNGGRGVFALDVSFPSAFDSSNVMWEFTQQDDPDMGNVVGTPRILKFRTSGSQSPTPTYKWFAVVASGVNNYVPDSSGVFGSGYPALFLLDLDKAKGIAWKKGKNYYKISIPVNGNLNFVNTYSQSVGTALQDSKPTGLVNFSYALGAAREVEYMFMGDLHGQLWKLDFIGVGSPDWDINRLSAFKGSGSKPIPLYVAKDSSGTAQPITAPPMIANGPLPKSHYVLFGTGSYLTASDQFLTTPQSVYMIYDNAKSDADTTSAPLSAISGRNRLKLGTASGGSVSVPPFTLGRAETNLDSEYVRSGWYFDLPSSGERVISKLVFSGDTAIFSSMIPITNTTSNQCIPDTGSGNTYDVQIAGGNGFVTSSNVGLMAPPIQFNLTDSITYPLSNTKTNSNGRRLRVIPTKKIQIGTLGTSVIGGQDKKEVAGRLNWRQINNFQDLKNK